MASFVPLPHQPSAAAELRLNLAELDREIATLQAKLAQLFAARKPVVDALKSIVYPILTIPPELTAEIFTNYVSRVYIGARSPLSHNQGAPWVLASVCRAWRDIALQLPRIWSRIIVANGDTSDCSSAEQLLKCCLERTGSAALELDVALSKTPDSMLSVLLPHSLRWKSFGCRITPEISGKLHELQGRIASLQSVYLHGQNHDTQAPVHAFENAPLLRAARIYSLSLARINLPWKQLTALTWDGHDATECVHVLQLTPQLESLCLCIYASARPSSTVKLSRLRTFRVQQTDETFIGLLNLFTLPALEHLELDVLDPTGSGAIGEFRNLLDRSKCGLLSLTLNDLDPSTALIILQYTPTLTSLTLGRVQWDLQPDLFSNIAHNPSFVPLPNLRKLVVETVGEPLHSTFPYRAIEALLGREARDYDKQAPLEEFHFIIPPYETSDISVEGLEAIRAMASLRRNCNVYISLPRMSHIRSNPPTHETISYTLENLDGSV